MKNNGDTKMTKVTKLANAIVISAAIFLGTSPTWAAGTHGGGHGGAATIGKPGNRMEVSRTIEIKMFDNYYEPEALSVKEGETLRFVVKNSGELVHEFNIGTAAMHTAHQKEMAMMVAHGILEADKINHAKMGMGHGQAMQHEDPNSILLEPGKTGEVIWTFSKASEIEFACNVPGHYGAGMVGRIGFNKLPGSGS